MKIQNHFDGPLLKGVNDLIFNEVYLRIVLFGRVFPSSIEITANKRTSIVAVHNSIRIDHWKNLENEVIP